MIFDRFRGQSAIEYLMTYGWMLLVVAIAGGTIFSITGDQAVESVSGFTGSDVQVRDFGFSGNSLDLVLRNAASEEIEIQSMKIIDPDTGASVNINSSQEISVGENAQTGIPGIETGGSSEAYDLEVTYDFGGLENIKTTGTITGSLDVFNKVYIEKAGYNQTDNLLKLDILNTGSEATDSLSYTVEASDQVYRNSLQNLEPGERTEISISTNNTYSLQSVSLETGGPNFQNSQSNLQCVSNKDLVGYWSFNEEQTKNGQAIDLSGYENHGSLEKSIVTGKEGQVGESYKFDGSGANVEVSDDSAFDLQKEFTFVVSLKPDLSISESANIIAKDNSAYRWRIQPDGGQNVILNNGSIQVYGNGQPLENNTWTNAALRFNGSNSELAWFIDGELQKSEDTGIEELSTNDFSLRIGSYRGIFEHWKGKIDEVRIYNESLTQSEIQRLSNVDNENWATNSCRLTN